MYLGKPTLLGNAHTSRGVVQRGQEVGVIGVPQGALGNGRERERGTHAGTGKKTTHPDRIHAPDMHVTP